MWFQGNNSDNFWICPWIPFGLFTQVSPSPFLSLFLPPLPKSPARFPSPQHVLLWPLRRVEKAASHSRWVVVSIQSVAWLALLVVSCSRGTSSVRGFGGIYRDDIPVPLFGTLSVMLSPFLGWRYKPAPEFVAQGPCLTVMPQKVPGFVHITGDLGSGLLVCLKDGFPVTPRHTTGDCNYISSPEVSHRKIWAIFLWSLSILENCFIQEPFYRIPWRSLLNLIQNTSLSSKLHNVSQSLLRPANGPAGTALSFESLPSTRPSRSLQISCPSWLLPSWCFPYMGCCLVAPYLVKSSLGTFSSWCLISGHLFLFLTWAEHFPAWQKLCSPLLHPWRLCFLQIQRKTLKQSS